MTAFPRKRTSFQHAPAPERETTVKTLKYSNGFRYGNMPVSPRLVRIIFRLQVLESIQRQRRAFRMIASQQGW